MKRFLTFLIFAVFLVVSVHAETGRITLSSGGKHTYFRADKLQDAINAAQPNDTIYLSPGIFRGVYEEYTNDEGDKVENYTLRITKPLTFIGTGSQIRPHDSSGQSTRGSMDKITCTLNSASNSNSVINATVISIDIAVPSASDKMVFEGILFDTFWPETSSNSHDKHIKSESDLLSLIFKNCAICSVYSYEMVLSFTIYERAILYSDKTIKNLIIDNCDFLSGSIDLSGVRTAKLSNSFFNKILSQNQDDDNSSVVDVSHCFASIVDVNSYQVKIENSFVPTTNAAYDYVNCFDCEGSFTMSAEYIINAGYACTDGTAIGPHGGDTPISHLPALITLDFEKSNVSYNPSTRKMDIHMEVVDKARVDADRGVSVAFRHMVNGMTASASPYSTAATSVYDTTIDVPILSSSGLIPYAPEVLKYIPGYASFANELMNQYDFTYTFSDSNVALNVSGNVVYAFQFLSNSKEWSVPYTDVLAAYETANVTPLKVEVPSKAEITDADATFFKAVKFYSDGSAIIAKTSTTTVMSIYSPDGNKVLEISPAEMIMGKTMTLDKGNYYAVLHLVPGLTGTPSSYSLTLTNPDNRVPMPSIWYEYGNINMSCPQPEAEIWYVTDAANATSSATIRAKGTRYQNPFAISRNMSVWAIATLPNSGINDSQIQNETFNIFKVNKPTITTDGCLIVINKNDDPDTVKTYYTTDGTTPTEECSEYLNPFPLSADAIIRAKSFRDGYTPAESDPFTYNHSEFVTPTPDIRDTGDGVVISGSGEGAVYFYRLDAADEYSPCPADGYIPIDYNTGVFAKAVIEGMYESMEKSIRITNRMTGQPFLKSFDAVAGRVYLGCKTPNHTIYFRIGQESGFSRYEDYVEVSGNVVIQAYASSDRRNDSEVVDIPIYEFQVDAPLFSGYDGRCVTISWPDKEAKVTCTLEGTSFTPANGERIDMLGFNTISAEATKENLTDSYAEFTSLYYSDETRIMTTAPGQVTDALAWRSDRDASELALHGHFNAADFAAVRDFKSLAVLDLAKVTDAALPEGAFVGLTELRHLTMPETLSSGSGVLFGSNPVLCSVTFTGLEKTMPQGLLDGIDNSNLLVYILRGEYAASIPERFPNIVYGGKAERLVLSGEHPFDCPEDFTAAEATYTKDFTKQTVVGQCSGWEAVVLPFAASEFRHADRGAVLPFASPKSGTDLRFWLFAREGEEWAPVDSLRADIPYLVSMPNSQSYEADFNIPGTVTFKGNGARIPVTDLSGNAMPIHGSDLIVPTYGFVPMTPYMQAVNDDDISFGGDDYLAGGAYLGLSKGQARDIRPFEWYIETLEPNKAPRPILGSSEVATLLADSALEVWAEGDEICVLSGSAREVRVHDLTGQTVCVLRAEPGQTVRTAPLAPGLYLVAGRKLLLK